MNDAVLLDIHDGLATITLNRPERANVLDLELAPVLIRCIDQTLADAGVRAVLLRAQGKHFCAGGYIADFAASLQDLPGLLDRHIPPLHVAIHKLATSPLPVVSALNGPIGGGGIGLALCADIVVAAESMKLRGGYSAIGLTPDAGGSWFLTRRVGAARAKEIFFLNAAITSAQCLAWGVVSQVVPDAQLGEVSAALANSLAHSATGSLGRIKQLVDGAADRPLQEQLDMEHRFMVESGATPHAHEGVTAFMAKRAPRF
jgi:2-(1,2-epoxy-1,2-dihydrophenyl)acetyl-CoA isomerase